ncbi:YciI family protein [Streptomyces sp. YJ-C3]
MRYALFLCAPLDHEGVTGRGAGEGGCVRLRPPCDATTVRVRGDEVLLGDGPFDPSAEYVAAIDLVEAADLDDALALAARHPGVPAGGAVEIRPVWE